jgi:hypothetical protein
MEVKAKKCKECGELFKPRFSTTETECSITCFNKKKKTHKKQKPIKKVGDKRALEDIIYRSERIKFLQLPENKICPITKGPATQIHHMRKRRGYADEWAIENRVSLYLDKRFWLGVSHEGHEKIENNHEWACENGYSFRSNQK